MEIPIHQFLLAWIPLFVAMDPLGIVPIFLALSRGVEISKIRHITIQAIATATIVAIGFVFLGQAIFSALGISVSDFQIAGGLILFGLATKDLLGQEEPNPIPREDFGVVPLGLPLIAGPATLTSLLILVDTVGLGYTLAAFFVNVALIYLSLSYSQHLQKLIGKTGLHAISKIITLLLAAIAVSMIRRGLESI